MANIKRIYTRIIQKHALEAEWQAISFVPLQGEAIIYDPEIDNEGNVLTLPEGRTVPYTFARQKIGDGFTDINQLPFVTSWSALAANPQEVIFDCGTAAQHIKLPEERLEGDGQEFYTATPSTLTFRSPAPLNELQDVQINGKTVDPSNYTLEEGSTIVKLKHDYLNTLDKGKHEVAIVSKNQIAKGDFTIRTPELNEQGFYYKLPYVTSVDIYGTGEFTTYTIWFTDDDTVAGVASSGIFAGLDYASCQHENKAVSFSSLGNLSFSGSFSANGKDIQGTAELYGQTKELVFTVTNDPMFSDDFYVYIKHANYISYLAFDRNNLEYPMPKNDICGLPVSTLYEAAAFANTNVRSIELPNSLTSIPDSTFNGCANLRSITIPDSVVTIGNQAFYNCGYLIDLVIPEGVTTIGDHAFYKCGQLSNLTLPSSLTSIGSSIISSCNYLSTINYAGTVEQAQSVLAPLLEISWKDTGSYTLYCTDGKITSRGAVTMY